MTTGIHSLEMQRKAYLQVGVIVSQVNRVEMEINRLIAAYYGGTARVKELDEDIVSDSRMSLSLKLDIFDKIALKLDPKYNESNTKSDLLVWRKIRNIVAHGVVGQKGNQVTVLHQGKNHALNGKFSEFGKKQELIISYIRNLSEIKI